PVAVDVRAEDLHNHLASLTPCWLVLTPRDGQSLDAIHRAESFVIAVGAEGRGVTPEVDRLADQRITLPIDSRVESLNATVAASILLFELSRPG
ncbi:MAG: TrmH family RNA methyltransferase, partial [Acidobacteriota bacterium]